MSHLKKTLAIFLLVCMLASMMPTGTAFAMEEEPGAGCPHVHTADVAEVPATCTTPGKTAGVVCNDCGATLSGCEEIALAAHSWNNGACTVCGATDPASNASGGTDTGTTPDTDTPDPAACTHEWADAGDGSTNRKCSKCGVICNHMGCFNHDGLCTFCGYQCPHTGKWGPSNIDPKNSVCSGCRAVCMHTKAAEGGSTVSAFADGKCSVCGLACAHASVEDVAEAKATCTEAGHAAGKKCTACGVYTEGGTEIPALGHKWDYTDPNLAKCTNGCGLTCSHEKTADGTTTKLFEKGVCSVCSYACTHTKADGSSAFDADGKCGICENTCTHKWNYDDKAQAVCDICKATCAHEGGYKQYSTYSKCTTCSFRCEHEKLTGNTCDTCKGSIEAIVTNGTTVKKYRSLSDVILSGQGNTITLLTDAVLKNRLNISQSDTVLDLNGKKLTGPSGLALWLKKGSLTIKNGTIESGGNGGSGVIYVSGGSKITIEKSATVNGKTDHGIFIAEKGTTAEIYGTLLSDNQAALTGNGTAQYAGTIINVYDGAVLTSTNGVAIYHPQDGTLNVKGGTITGGSTGVEIRAGTANISGGLVEGKGDPFAASPNGSGSTTVGAGLAVVQHSTKCAITVNVAGGTLKGVRAIYEGNHSNSTPEELAKVNINVTGGTLSGDVFSSDDKITFSGAAKDQPMKVPTTEDAANPNAVVADPNYVHAGAKNQISAGAKTDAVISKKALLECASSSDTIVTVDTAEAAVSLDGTALKKINEAVADGGSATVHVAKLAETADGKTFEVYVTDQDGNKIGSGNAGALIGSATVVLKGIAAEPKQVRHYDKNEDGSFRFLETPNFTYNADDQSVTVTIDHFSLLETSTHAVPVIDPATLTAPEAWTGEAYAHQLKASGDGTIEWSVTGDLPKGLALSKDGKISGTVASDAEEKDYTVTVRAENAYGFDEKELTITVQKNVVARLLDENANEIGTYSTVQEAVDAAEALGGDAFYTVVVEQDSPDENVLVENANVIILGLGLNAEATKLKSITYGPGCEGGVMSIVADTVTVQKDATVYLSDGNNIKKVVNKNTIGNIDNVDPRVYIDGGHYGSLSPAKGGSYTVTGGTFNTELPMEYCREVVTDDNGNIVVDKEGNPKIVQRYAKYDSARKAYVIAPFKFEITAVSNSGYHMPGSQKTLVFSTNLDYTLADRDRADCSITVTTGNSSKPISSVYYEISADKNGKAQITLKASTLNKLSLGRYTLTYDGPVGRDSMYFHISNTVKTGDTSNIGLWMGIMGVSVVALCAVAAVLVIKSKKKNGGAKDDKK